MQDQVSSLEAMGIPAVLINSGQSLGKPTSNSEEIGQVRWPILRQNACPMIILNLVQPIRGQFGVVDEARIFPMGGE